MLIVCFALAKAGFHAFSMSLEASEFVMLALHFGSGLSDCFAPVSFYKEKKQDFHGIVSWIRSFGPHRMK